MNVYGFIFDGENNDGDLINLPYYEVKANSQKDALNMAIKEAMDLLDVCDGGHLDIFDGDYNFICDVEN